jgi:hypothetical protein
LDSIPKDSVSGLRDLALIAAMFYSFARVSVASPKFLSVSNMTNILLQVSITAIAAFADELSPAHLFSNLANQRFVFISLSKFRYTK